MERNITITLEKAREWYNSDDESLKKIVLQAFSEDELLSEPFESIKTFKDACGTLGLNYSIIANKVNEVEEISKATAAMFKLNIVRKALNVGQDLYLTKDPEDSYVYYPCNTFATENSTYYKKSLNSTEIEVIGKIKSEGEEYCVLNNSSATKGDTGLCCFYSLRGTASANAELGFLGCASREIAKHFGKYFGMLITEAKYADMVDFEIIENKYQ